MPLLHVSLVAACVHRPRIVLVELRESRGLKHNTACIMHHLSAHASCAWLQYVEHTFMTQHELAHTKTESEGILFSEQDSLKVSHSLSLPFKSGTKDNWTLNLESSQCLCHVHTIHASCILYIIALPLGTLTQLACIHY